MPCIERAQVISNSQVSSDLFEMELKAPQIVPLCKPGQFIHLRVSSQYDPLLRRPLSLYDVDRQQNTITLLYKVVGKGTEILSRTKSGEYLDIMGPLGRAFSWPQPGQSALLVGGGVGIAPLLFLTRELLEQGYKVKVLYGAQSSQDLAALNRFRRLGAEVWPATMDGQTGYPGLVTDLLKEQLSIQKTGDWFIYTCGPEPMMAQVAAYAHEYGLKGEVSLEENMACGVGACLGCARQLKSSDKSYVKVCKDGPVFALQEVELNPS